MDLSGQPFYNDPVFTRISAAILVCLATLFLPLAARADAPSVLVFSFENQTDDRNIDWIGPGLSELVVERLSAERGLYVFSRDERSVAYERMGIPEAVPISRATAMSIAWDTGADAIVIGRISGTHKDFHIEAHIVYLDGASSSPDVVVDGELQNVIPMATTLSFRLARQFVPATVIPESDYTAHPPIPSSAFEACIRGMIATDSPRRVALFQDAIRLHPQYSSAIFQLGRQYYLDMDAKNSTPLLEKITADSPDYLQAQFMLGLNYYNTGDFNKSAAIFSALPPVYDVLIDLGMALAGRGDMAGAMTSWKRASDLKPLGTEAYFNMAHLGLTRGERSDAEAAAKSIEQFLKLQGRDAEAIFLQGRIYERLGRVEESQRLMATAMNLSPRVGRWMNQPLTNFRRLRTQPSITEIRLGPAASIWTETRLVRRAGGRDVEMWMDAIQPSIDTQHYGDALRELQDVARTFPQSSEVHVMMAEVYESQKQNDAAILEYQRAIALKPAADVYFSLSRLYRGANQTALERQAINNALQIEPGNPRALNRKTELDRLPGPRRRPQ